MMTVGVHFIVAGLAGIATGIAFRYFGERDLIEEIRELRHENQWLKAALKAEIFKDRP